MPYSRRYFGVIIGAVLVGVLASPATDVLAAEKERINPTGVFKHPNFTRVSLS